MLDYLLKLLVDVCVLGLGVGVAKLRTWEVVLLGSDIGENFEEIGQSGDKGGRGGGNGDDRRRSTMSGARKVGRLMNGSGKTGMVRQPAGLLSGLE